MSFRAQLLERAARRGARVVLCEGADERVRAAVDLLRAKKVVEPIVLGGDGIDPAKDHRLGRIAKFLRERRPDRVRDGVHALDIAADPVNFGAALVALGEADGCVAGAVCPTGEVVRAALWAIGTAPGVSLVSSSFYMVMPGDLVLTFTDCAVVPEPTPGQLAEIALAAARDRARLVGDSPRVAFLSYSSKGSASGPHVARVQEAAAHFQQLAPNIPSDGELQDRRWAGAPMCWYFPIWTRATLATSWSSVWAARWQSGLFFRGLRAPWPTCRGAPPPMILSR
jgi:phosphate acetyltransferase